MMIERVESLHIPGLSSEPPPADSEPIYVVGVDLGQQQDFSAIVIDHAVRLNPQSADTPVYAHQLVHLERPPRGTSYPTVVARVCALCAALPVSPVLVIDGTGVGVAITDLFQDAHPRCSWFLPVVITAGEQVTQLQGGRRGVPKKDLVGVVAVALQGKHLHVARALPEAATLTRELLGFRARITASGHVTYGTPDWRENEHDDLVLATALALWAGERVVTGWIFVGP